MNKRNHDWQLLNACFGLKSEARIRSSGFQTFYKMLKLHIVYGQSLFNTDAAYGAFFTFLRARAEIQIDQQMSKS